MRPEFLISSEYSKQKRENIINMLKIISVKYLVGTFFAHDEQYCQMYKPEEKTNKTMAVNIINIHN